MKKAVFFDLDGTLLPLDMEKFMHGYDALIDQSGLFEFLGGTHTKPAFKKSIHAMLQNDGRAFNSDVFLNTLYAETKADPDAVSQRFDAFYRNGFLSLKSCTRTDRHAIKTVSLLRQKGYRLVLATNPLFPPVATNARIKWAGLDINDFEYISYFDNSRYCKPNPEYFLEILDKTGLSARECYFVGNDVADDMACLSLGFEGFLVLDHLIGDARRVPSCAKGYYSDLLGFAESLPKI